MSERAGGRIEGQPNRHRRLWSDLRFLRVAGALLIAALPLTAGMLPTALVSGADLTSSEDIIVLASCYPMALVWLGLCAGVHLGFAYFRGEVTRRQCLIWGMAAAFLAGAAVSAFFYPLLEEAASRGEVNRAGVVSIPIILVPFILLGLVSGWVYWRLGIRPVSQPRTPRPDPVDRLPLTPRHRRWRDLPGGRLWLSLTIAPVLVTALLTLLWIVDGEMPGEEIIVAAIGVLILTTIYWQMGGWGYLLAVTRARRRISRIECLLLSLALADLLAPVLLIFVFAIEGMQGVVDMFGGRELNALLIVAALAIVAILFAPIGLLTGWLFWRIGVWPAPVPHPDVSEVFD